MTAAKTKQQQQQNNNSHKKTKPWAALGVQKKWTGTKTYNSKKTRFMFPVTVASLLAMEKSLTVQSSLKVVTHCPAVRASLQTDLG